MLCKIWGVHGGDYIECRFLGCGSDRPSSGRCSDHRTDLILYVCLTRRTASVVSWSAVPGCGARGSWFESRSNQILSVVGLEGGPLSLVRITEELLGREIDGSGLENRDLLPWGSAALTTRNPSIRKSWYWNLMTSVGRSVGIVRLLSKGQGVCLLFTRTSDRSSWDETLADNSVLGRRTFFFFSNSYSAPAFAAIKRSGWAIFTFTWYSIGYIILNVACRGYALYRLIGPVYMPY
jgi:hypothetical protein